jgi:hypothetical protein
MNAHFVPFRALVLPLALVFGLAGAGAAGSPGPAAADASGEKWQPLFDGRTLGNWKASGFYGEGAVKVLNPFQEGSGAIVLEEGSFLSGITWTKEKELPRTNYEIALEAMRVEGGDFFCGLTFPVGESACTLIVGGWGGMVVGLSNVNEYDAAENETTTAMEFAPKRWYRIRLRVTPEKIEAWIDNRQMVELELADKKIGLRWGDIDKSLPLGISAYQTRAALRDLRLRRLE